MAQHGTGYGDQIRQTDEYGNPLPHTGGVTGAHATHAGEHDKKEHGHGGILHRSHSSSSSSSSEDDGQGGRRKKLKDKLKDKLPGGKKEHGDTATATPGSHGHETEQQPEKKGFMDKIKEKLPGHH